MTNQYRARYGTSGLQQAYIIDPDTNSIQIHSDPVHSYNHAISAWDIGYIGDTYSDLITLEKFDTGINGWVDCWTGHELSNIMNEQFDIMLKM